MVTNVTFTFSIKSHRGAEARVGGHVKYLLLLPDFNQNWNVSRKIFLVKIRSAILDDVQADMEEGSGFINRHSARMRTLQKGNSDNIKETAFNAKSKTFYLDGVI